MENAIPPCGLYERCDSYGGVGWGRALGHFCIRTGVYERDGVFHTHHMACCRAISANKRQVWFHIVSIGGWGACRHAFLLYRNIIFTSFNVRCVTHSLLLHRDLRLPGHKTLNLLWNSILSRTYKRSHVYTHFFPSNHYFTLSAAHTTHSIDFHEQNVCAPPCNKGTHVMLTPRNIAWTENHTPFFSNARRSSAQIVCMRHIWGFCDVVYMIIRFSP